MNQNCLYAKKIGLHCYCMNALRIDGDYGHASCKS